MGLGSQIALVMSSIGKTQIDKETPLGLGDLDLRINVTSRAWVDTVKTINELLDCIKEEITGKEVTRVIYRLPIEGEFVPEYCIPLAALAYGGAASPSGGTPANKIFTITLANHTGGTYFLDWVYDGLTCKTVNIPYDASAALMKRILEDLDCIGYGNTTVSKVGEVFTVELIGKRGYAPVTSPTANITNLEGVGASVTINQTQAGVNKSHNITETTGYNQKLTTIGIAFEDEAGSERLLVGAAIENIVFTLPENNEIIRFSADIVARSFIVEPELDIPACQVYRTYRTGDCLLTRNSVDLTSLLRDAAFNFNNNTLTGNSAYTGRGVKMSRTRRAIRRTRSLTYTLLAASASVTDSLYEEALNNPEGDVKRATSLRIGTEGKNITVNIPNGLDELATGSGGLGFDNESEEALIRVVNTPTKIGGVAPSNLVAKINQAGTYLTPAS